MPDEAWLIVATETVEIRSLLRNEIDKILFY